MKRIAEMVECSHGTVTKVLHFHDRTSSDMFSFDGLPLGFSISPKPASYCMPKHNF